MESLSVLKVSIAKCKQKQWLKWLTECQSPERSEFFMGMAIGRYEVAKEILDELRQIDPEEGQPKNE